MGIAKPLQERMTKIILTGATGLVGGQVLKTAIADARVTSIVILSRRELDDKSLAGNSKVKTIIHKDFQRYSPELMEELKDATACIWCIGGMVKDFPNAATARKVQVTYAVSFAEALRDAGVVPMNFVFCSGAWAERQQDKELWYLEESRKIKGEAEAGLASISEGLAGFQTYSMRLGGVTPATVSGNLSSSLLSWSGPMVRVEQVAHVFIEIALNGAGAAGAGKSIFENADIVNFVFSDGQRRRSSVFSGGSSSGGGKESGEGRRGSILSFGRRGSKIGKAEA